MKEFDDDEPLIPNDSSDDAKDDSGENGKAKSGSVADDWPEGDANPPSDENPKSTRPTDEQKGSSDDGKDDTGPVRETKSGSNVDDWPDGDANPPSDENPKSTRPTDEQKGSSDDGKDDTGPVRETKSGSNVDDWPDGDANPPSDENPKSTRPTDEQMDRQNAENISVMRTQQEILRQQKDDEGVHALEEQIQKIPASDDIKSDPRATSKSLESTESARPTDEQMDRQNAENISVMRTQQEILRQQKDDEGVHALEEQIQKIPASDDIKSDPRATSKSLESTESARPTDEQMDRQNAENISVMRTQQEILRQQKDDEGVHALEEQIQKIPASDDIKTDTLDLSNQQQFYDNSAVKGRETGDAPEDSSESGQLGDTKITLNMTPVGDIQTARQKLDDTHNPEFDEMRPLREYRDQHPEMFRNQLDTDPFPEVTEAFTSPDDWVDRINPRGPYWDGTGGEPGRNVNCVDCARATERAWRGESEISAANLVGGERSDGIEAWSGTSAEEVSFSEISERLQRGGHGSSAMILGERKGLRGHAFNAVNLNGQILFVDAQPIRGAVDYWPPKRTSPGYRYIEADFSKISAVMRDGSRRSIR